MTVRIMLTKESTEGFEKIAEEERKKEQVLAEMYKENEEEQELVGAGR